MSRGGVVASTVQALVAGDLDNDGDPDLGSEGGEIIAWQNSATWISLAIGSLGSGAVVYALAISDLDIASGSSNEASYEIRVWQNDGTPFDSTWASNNVGAARAEDVTVLAWATLTTTVTWTLCPVTRAESWPSGRTMACLSAPLGLPASNDGFFSDAKYADLDDVDWRRRSTDLMVGRVVGFTPPATGSASRHGT